MLVKQSHQYGFFIDTTKCNGCKTCMVACKDNNDLPIDRKWRRIYEFAGGSFTRDGHGAFEQNVVAFYASISCNHCSQPACVKACPVGAMHKRRSDGFVHVDQSICIGCGSCHRACPYNAPQMDFQRRVMTKCDGCYDRVAQGKLPSCVDSCPNRAIEFGPIDELRAKHGSNADMQGIPSSSITHPNLIIKVNPNAEKGIPVQVNNPNEVIPAPVREADTKVEIY